MSLHPNLRKRSMTPKEKAVQLAENSTELFQPKSNEPYYAVPIRIAIEI